MNLRLPIAALCATLFVGGCAGAGQTPSPIPGGNVSPNAARAGARVRKGALSIRIRIPKRGRRGNARSHYISAGTKGMTMAFAGPSSFTQVVDLTSGSTGCSNVSGFLSCSVEVALPAGRYSATVNTYDLAPVDGSIPVTANVLSTASNITFSISPGVANQIGFTLDGAPATLAVEGFPTVDVGTAFAEPQNFTVAASDADGYRIVGGYTTPVVLTDSDATGATAIATTGSDTPPNGELLSSGDVATISYNGAAIPPVTVGASAGTATGSVPVPLVQPVFVGDSFNNAAKMVPAGCVAAACVSTVGGGFDNPGGVAVDKSFDVYVADVDNGAVKEVPHGCVLATCVITIGGGFSTAPGAGPADVAVDGFGNVYVADIGNNEVKEVPSGCRNASCVATLGAGFYEPGGVAVDNSGNVYVADTHNSLVKEVPHGCTSASCVTILGGGFSYPIGIAVDASDNLFIGDAANHMVKEIPHGCASATCVTVLGGGFGEPYGVAIDGSDNVYVADFEYSAIKEIPRGCTAAACVATLGGGFKFPTGVAIPRV